MWELYNPPLPSLFLKQSGISVKVFLGHILHSAPAQPGHSGPKHIKYPPHIMLTYLSCACPVFNTKAICWGSHSPISPFQHCLLCWWVKDHQDYLSNFWRPLSETSDHPRQKCGYALQQLQEQVWRLALQHCKLLICLVSMTPILKQSHHTTAHTHHEHWHINDSYCSP